MPFDDDNVLFSASWDNSKFNDGINVQVDGFEKLKTKAAGYEKQLSDVTAVIKENELETLNLNKRNNELKDRIGSVNTQLIKYKTEVKGTSGETRKLQTELKALNAEQKNVQSQLRGITTNTKEFRIEQAALKASITSTNASLKLHTTELKTAEAASGKFSKGINSAFSSLRSLALILPGIGIAGLFGLAYEAISKAIESLDLFGDKLTEVEKRQSLMNDVVTEANETAGKQIATVKLLTEAVQDNNIPMKERLAAVKELQKQFPEYFGQLSQEAILTGDITKATNDATEAIIRAARARAAKGRIDEIESQKLDIQFRKEKIINATNRELAAATAQTGDAGQIVSGLGVTAPSQGLTKKQVQDVIINRRLLALNDQNEKEATLQRQEDFLKKFVGLEEIVSGILPPPPKVAAAKAKKIAKIKEEMKKEFVDIAALQRELDELLLNERIEAADRRIENIKDTFEREKELIFQEELKGNVDLIRRKEADIKVLNDAFIKGVYGDTGSPEAIAQFEIVRATIVSNYDRLYAELVTRISDKNRALAAKTFQANLDALKETFAGGDNQREIIANNAVIKEAERFARKEITYKQFIDNVKKIDNDALKVKIDNDIKELQSEKALITVRLTSLDISEKELIALKKQSAEIDAQISKLQRQSATTGLKPGEEKPNEGLDKALRNFLLLQTTVVDFYTAIGDAEQNSLNRSIALQKQRVDNARFIAERGNAEYLELEQKRLDELERKQAASAQKQIAIANAVAASQALVAVIQAIAQPGPFGIAGFATVVALIAAAYKFVSSLQPVSTSFYEGTDYVPLGDNKPGRDTVRANLNQGEAVIQTENNRMYSPTVKAIRRQSIPASVLNDFVTHYPNYNIPSTDYGRLAMATDFKTTEQNETNKKLDRVYQVLNSIDESLLNFEGSSVNLDQNGFSMALMKMVRRERLKLKM